jgi:hypothetical protein
MKNCILEYIYINMTKFIFVILRSHSYEPPQMRTKILVTLFQIIIQKKKYQVKKKKKKLIVEKISKN